MPKYLAIDYLTNALQQRRNAVLRMVLATPHQPEYVESSLLKNSTGYYKTPWQKEHPLKLTMKDATEYLKGIVFSSNELEIFSPSLQESDIVPSSNPDSPLVSFDLWSDVGGELTNCVVQGLAPEKVELTGQESLSSCKEVEHLLLEDTVTMDHFQDILKWLPNLNKLCSRFKIKLIQDPFLDSNGKPFDEHIVLRNNRCCNMEEKQIWSAERWGKENFLKLLLESGKEKGFSLQTWEIEQPADTNPCCTALNDETHPKELEKLLKLNKEDTSQVLQMEALAATKHTERVIRAPEFEVEAEETAEKRKHNFIKLNDQGYVAKEEALSVMKDKRLESPSGAVEVTTPPDTRLKRTVGNLADLEMSPTENIQFLTPRASDKCVSSLRESEKALSEVYARTLAVPDTPGNSRTSTSSIQTAVQSLSLKNEDVEGGLEPDLVWDPLAGSSSEMDKTQTRARQSVSLQDVRSSLRNSPAFQELFQRRSPKGVSVDPLPDTVVSLPILKPPDSGAVSKRNQPDRLLVKTAEVKDMRTHPSYNTTHQSEAGDKIEAKPHVISRDDAEQWSSGLDEFLFLRTADRHSPSTRMPPKTIVRAAKVRPCPSVSKETKPTESQALPTLEVLDIHLTDDFQEVIETVLGHAEPLLSRLKESGVVSVGKDLATLSVEFTRFLVKQAEMAISDQSDKDNTEEKQGYVMVVCLHALVTAADLLVNCGLTAAVAHLNETQEKHATLIGDTLGPARRYLFKVHFHFQQGRRLHPKLSKLLRTVGQWIQSHPEQKARAKLILLLNRHQEQLYKEISEALTTLPSVRCALYNGEGGTDIMELLTNHEVVVTALSSITAGFPWREFDFVVEYEHRSGATREDLYTDNSRLKRHVAFRSCSKNADATHMIPKNDEEQIPDRQEQYAFIGGQKITGDVELLQLLESRYHVLIYERDYDALSCGSKEDSLRKMSLQPDLTIDERTSVVLQGFMALEAQGEFDKLKDAVLAMSLKCQRCYVILHSAKASDSAFTARVSRQLSLLFASTAHFTGARADSFTVKVLFSFSADETAKLIRSIGDSTRSSSTVWEREEWTRRKWLTDEMSAHERFLLSFPCINSFSAQILLTAAPLSQLLRMSLRELKETCPWIDDSILNAFHRTVGWSCLVDQTAPLQMLPVTTDLPHSRQNETSTPPSAHDAFCEGHPTSKKLKRFRNDSNNRTLNNDWRATSSESVPENCLRDASANSKPQGDNERSSRETQQSVGRTMDSSEYQQQSRDTALQMEQASFENYQDFDSLFRNESEQSRAEQKLYELHGNQMTTKSSESLAAAGLNLFQGRNSELENMIEDGNNRTCRQDSLVSRKDPFGNCTRHMELLPGPVNRLQLHTSHGQLNEDVRQLKHLTNNNGREFDDLQVQETTANCEIFKRPQQRPSGMERAVQPSRRLDWRTLANEDLQRCIQGEIQPHEDTIEPSYTYSTHMETQSIGQRARLNVDPMSGNSAWANNFRRQEHRAEARTTGHPDQQRHPRVLHVSGGRRHRPYFNIGVAQPLRRVSSVTSTEEQFSQPGKITQPDYRAGQSGRKRFSREIMQPVYNKAMSWRGERTVPGLEPSPEGQADEISIFPSLADQVFPFKRRKLIYEKVPGDESGQTRLFFQEK